jgi:hypothetical protein
MLAKIEFSLVSLALALTGCGSRSLIVGRDAGTARDSAALPDSAANGDAFVGSDVFVPADVLPDLALLPDVALSPDAAPDGDSIRPDVASDPAPDRVVPTEVAVDNVRRDGPVDLLLRDLPLITDLGGDSAVRDQAAEPQPADVGSPDAAGDVSPEAAREVPPFVVDGALASFCSGDLPRMVVNGIESNPAVTGKMIPYDCCDGGEFDVTTQTFSYPIVVPWRRMASAAFRYPASVDLASLPSDWSVRVVAGCDPIQSSCGGPGDGYTTGIEGVLEVDGGGSQFDMSLCLHVVEPAGSSHPLIHTLDLYAPHVLATY